MILNHTNLCEYLNMRTDWEEIVQGFKIDPHYKSGTIPNLEWFIEHGHTNNRFRVGFKRATSLAKKMLDLYDKK